MRTHNTWVVSSIPPSVTFKTPLVVRKATGNHIMNSTYLEKLRALSLVSAKLEIEYALEFYENTIGAECNREPPHKIHFPRKSSEPCLWFLLSSKLSMLWNSMKILLVQNATGNHRIKSISLEKAQSPVSGFC